MYLVPPSRYKAPKSSTGNESATFFKYGNTYMDRKSQAEFYSRSLYDMCRYFVNQIPSEVGFTIEPDDFIGSFSYLDEDEHVIAAPRWDDALPTEVDRSQRGVEARERRAASERVWEDHYARTAGLIPSRFMLNPELREVVNPSQGTLSSSAVNL